MPIARRTVLSAAVASTLAIAVPRLAPAADAASGAGSAASAFGFDQVAMLARLRAGRPWTDNRIQLPEPLKSLSYDRYRDLRFRPDRALWRDGGLFQVQLFHLGSAYDRPVRIHLVEGGRITPLAYDPDLFDLSRVKPGPLPADLGFAGFRLHFPLMRPDYFDEFAAFLGASYFRLIGRNQVYGLSCRGLAIDTALASGEEFPYFTDFWLERPPPGATAMTVHALLDSPSLAAAFRFVLHPDDATQAETRLVVYPRRDVAKLGLAPLTSMFLFGPNNRRFDDFRPEVHDSDGLLVNAGNGEWLWRPLVNGRGLRDSAQGDAGIRGFGLLQRNRDAGRYLDAESRFEARPSLWVEPIGDWGPGSVELIEIPSDQEIHDNIVAFWVRKAPVKAGEPVEVSYRLQAYLDVPERSPGGRVRTTRIGTAKTNSAAKEVPDSARLFAVAFGGAVLERLGPGQPVEAVVSSSAGGIGQVVTAKLADGSWEATFQFLPDGSKPADLRCYLRLRGDALTETWAYLWTV